MNIKYNKQAKKYLDRLPKNTAKKIITAINKLPKDGDIRSLAGFNNAYRLRTGANRVIWEMDNLNIYIRKIAPRGQVYKK